MDELGLVARREEEWVTRNGRVLGEARPAAAVHCPVPAQRARDRCIHPGTKTCPPIPDLLCLRDISGVPFEYVNGTGTNRATRLTVVTRRTAPVVQRFTPPIRDALTSFLANMTRFGMPIEALLTLGSLYCRCVTGSDTLSNHSFGDAIDIVGVRWPPAGGPASRARETIVYNWANPDQRSLLRRIDACLRLSFNTVIDYHRTDHRDHFHCDSNSRAGSVRAMGRSTTTPHFVQEALSHVLGRPVPETGQWDRATMNALQQFSGVDAQGLKNPRRLNEVLDQLFTRVASGASAAPAGPMGLDWFRFDSSTLTPYHNRLIDRIASRVAASWQGARPIREVRLTGHTDSRGSTSYNETLGLRRAQAVKNALSRAIEARQPGTASRLRYTTHSHGAARPVSPRTTEAARARNRRVEVTLAATPSPALEPAAAEHEAPPAVPALAAAAPALLYTESSVPTETHYVTIPLGQEAPAPPMTGIFVPAGYRRSSQVDLILYLQGHHKGGGFPADLAIDSYWLASRFPFWAFREGVNVAKKNAVLVAPTLGPCSQAGKLVTAGGLAWYLDQVMAALKAYGVFKAASETPTVGHLVIACHSGGGAAMRQIAATPQKYLDNVRQYWGFDCLYNSNDETFWANWARANSRQQLFIHFGNGGTAERSRRLQANARGLGNVSVDGSERVEHNRVPITHWQTRIRAARFFLDA